MYLCICMRKTSACSMAIRSGSQCVLILLYSEKCYSMRGPYTQNFRCKNAFCGFRVSVSVVYCRLLLPVAFRRSHMYEWNAVCCVRHSRHSLCRVCVLCQLTAQSGCLSRDGNVQMPPYAAEHRVRTLSLDWNCTWRSYLLLRLVNPLSTQFIVYYQIYCLPIRSITIVLCPAASMYARIITHTWTWTTHISAHAPTMHKQRSTMTMHNKSKSIKIKFPNRSSPPPLPSYAAIIPKVAFKCALAADRHTNPDLQSSVAIKFLYVLIIFFLSSVKIFE